MDERTSGASSSAASQALADLASAAWDQVIAGQPVEATALGDRRFDDRLRPNAPGAIESEVEVLSGLARRAEAIDPASLSAVERVTRSALIDFVGYSIDLDAAGIEA